MPFGTPPRFCRVSRFVEGGLQTRRKTAQTVAWRSLFVLAKLRATHRSSTSSIGGARSGDRVAFRCPPTLLPDEYGGPDHCSHWRGHARLLGVLMVAFVVYQLWGTALYTEHAQAHLKSDFSSELHRKLPSSAAQLTAGHHTGLPPFPSSQRRPTLTLQPVPAVGLLSIPKIGLLDAIVEGVGEIRKRTRTRPLRRNTVARRAGKRGHRGASHTDAHPFYNLNELRQATRSTS